MKIKHIILGGFLGLLAVVLSTPVNATMEITGKEDILQEAQTDGFIVDLPVHTSTAVGDSNAQSSTSTTESWMDRNLPLSQTELVKISPTIKASQRLSTNVMIEGSADTMLPTWTESGSGQFTTDPSVSYTPNSASTITSVTFASTTAESSMTIQTSQQPFTDFMRSTDTMISSRTEEGSGYITTTDSSTSHTTTTTFTTESMMTKIFGLSKTESSETSTTTQTSQEPSTNHIMETTMQVHGGSRMLIAPNLNTSATPNPTSTTESVMDKSTTLPESESATTSQALHELITEDIIENENVNKIGAEKPNSGSTSTATQVQSQNANKQEDPKHNKGHSTPDWIIILGFVVGLAALVALCAAIATREKWNGPNQELETKTNSSNQKRELEMQAFLCKEEPKENGKAAEYMVIPLDDLPASYSLH